ncbi:hypothetical protein [Paenibacillus hunanensis]|uniref:FtsP/CotA-like multicopper oxidase with cupredoxin domain n=1 Tax=Paenibacillus hunanensis TaxID=539262 RepID=A0ABU1IYS1_9BACL|nr:hypothetical protein [Paenibacillus hunanensis]MDR6244412.1 FtsP/CotA-like multicopper oxidase with cupredoxin domain [Paenibacillus hunanensis]GGI99292.1 hypothetical protein GCM10008022_05120 [Paenibacillus hunanensis]
MLKKLIATSVAAATLFSIGMSSTYAEENNQTLPAQENNYTSSLAAEQLQAARATLTFRWSGLQNRVASSSFKTSGGDLPITIVQWTDDPAGSPVMGYQLVNDSGFEIPGFNPIFVNGTFKANNTIRTFTNVPAGTYRVRVINYGSYAVSGNGNIVY